jgi:hypothetical protein
MFGSRTNKTYKHVKAKRERRRKETSRSAMNARKRGALNLCDDIASLSLSLVHPYNV